MTESSNGSTTNPLGPHVQPCGCSSGCRVKHYVHRVWCASVVYSVACDCYGKTPAYVVSTASKPVPSNLATNDVAPVTSLVTLSRKPGFVDLDPFDT